MKRSLLGTPQLLGSDTAQQPGEANVARSELDPPVDAVNLSRQVRLRNGTVVTVRPIRPDDAAREREFVRELSPESRYQRFLFTLDELTPEMLEQFTHVDYRRDMALIALLQLPESEKQIGVARYSRAPGGGCCDFAVVVSDHWRGTGLARELMQALIDAARSFHRLPVMEGITLAGNRRMQALARSLGFDTRMDPRDSNLVHMRRAL